MPALFEEDSNQKFMTGRFEMVQLYCNHIWNAVDMLQGKHRARWKYNYIRVHHVVEREGTAICQAEALKLANAANKPTAMVRRDYYFIEIKKAHENYAVAFMQQ